MRYFRGDLYWPLYNYWTGFVVVYISVYMLYIRKLVENANCKSFYVRTINTIMFTTLRKLKLDCHGSKPAVIALGKHLHNILMA